MIIWCSLHTHVTLFGQDTNWYSFKGTANLTINYSNSPGDKVWSIFTIKIFPDQEVRLSDTIPSGSGSRQYLLPVSLPQKVILTTSGKALTLLLTPGSALICNLDFRDITRTTFHAADSLALINEYLMKKDFSAGKSFKMRRANAVHTAANLQEFSASMNALYLEELQFFKKNIGRLPKWYQMHEYWDNRYADATERMNAILQRQHSQKDKESLPHKYYGFLDSLEINNQAAKSCASYYYFLYEFFNKRMNGNDLANGTKSSFIDYQIQQGSKELSSGASDLFKAFIIQLTFNHYKREVATEYVKKHDDIFSNSVWEAELDAYFKSKITRAERGKIPPNFVLADLKDSLTWLRSLKGNVIVLSFWFAGCKPCIEEFPGENALTEKFRGKPVKIVSVCVNTSEAVWRKSSERFGLKTINLWANPQWEKTIIEKYDLAVFPKYVLIDRDYKIADIHAERPSQGLEAQINSLLTK
ncbi:TlpA family protein disulfide reductase [Dyadobacter aurulentus]|uniref:TlpA family protein disulfide reductase n=1 Tax=Dyadobacter sp. UC 10 TaxID=2605428 RepID=UPI001788B392|nr:redoxin family protein [Dyadobacter sp. UC 10]